VVESVGTAPPDELQVQQDAHMEERRVPGADRRSDHERARTSLGGRGMEKRLREKLTASQLSDKKLFTQSINRIRKEVLA
jgi:hypothetical protein